MGSPSSGADALPNGLDVTFEVTEVKRLTGSYNTMVGNNEGSMVRETLSLTVSLICYWVQLSLPCCFKSDVRLLLRRCCCRRILN